jgi:hypothetical protein
MRKLSIFLPFLLTAYFIIFYYNQNFFTIAFSDVAVMLAVSLTIVVFVWLIVRLLSRQAQRATFITSVFVSLFFSFGHVFKLFQPIRIRFFPFDKEPNLLALWGFLALVGVIFAIRSSQRLRGINYFAGIAAAILLIINVSEIGLKAADAIPESVLPNGDAFEVQPADVLPDIYYIVLDEYAGNSALKRIGFDNTPFLEALERRGFYVATEARANYYKTSLSLASSLNIQYLDHLDRHRPEDQEPLYEMIRNNRVLATLKSLGYSYVHFASSMAPLQHNPHTDIFYNAYEGTRIRLGNVIEFNPSALSIGEYEIEFAKTTLLMPLISTFEDELLDVPDIAEPTFTFVHLFLPHFPYAFRRDDAPMNPAQNVDGIILDRAQYEEHTEYLEQLGFTNRVISHAIDQILEKSSEPPIILLQGDHGYRWLCPDCFEQTQAASVNWDAEYYSDVILPILSAYYLPNGGNERLYPAISPVNSFATIFDFYFGASIGPVDERYFMPEGRYANTYYFVDITQTVHEAQNINAH